MEAVAEVKEVNVKRTNSWRDMRGVRYVAVECPKCKDGGGHPIYSHQPKCHMCHKHEGVDTLMQPCWHSGITGEWNDAVEHFKELDTRLGFEMKA